VARNENSRCGRKFVARNENSRCRMKIHDTKRKFANIPSSKEKTLRPMNKCNATLIGALRGRSNTCFEHVSDLPGRRRN